MIRPSVRRRRGARLVRRIAAAMISIVAVVGGPLRATACDLCAIYTATEQRVTRVGPWLGVAQQFTSYDTLQENGHEVPNPDGQYLNSSITQFLAGYTVLPKLGFQLNLPVIFRNFRRPENGVVVDGSVSGIGDMVLLGNLELFSTVTENSVVRLTGLAGIKLPTGSPSRLKEELTEDDSQSEGTSAVNPQLHHGGEHDPSMVASGIHGHDLALGSGSTDAVLGAQLFGSWQRLFVTAAVQYLARTTGSFNYTYANALFWSGGPGAFVWVDHAYTVSLQANLSGESKGNDSLAGVPATDTAITTLFVGPNLGLTWGSSLGLEVGGDLPVIENNSSFQIVPTTAFEQAARGGFETRKS